MELGIFFINIVIFKIIYKDIVLSKLIIKVELFE